MTRRVEVEFAYRVRAFHDRVAEVREDELFVDPDAYRLRWVEVPSHAPLVTSEYEFRVVSPLPPPVWSRTRLRELTALIRPLLAERSDELASIKQICRQFGQACADPNLRAEMKAITSTPSSLDAGAYEYYDGADEHDRYNYTDRRMADAMLYGEMIHMMADKRIVLEELRSLGGDIFATEALVRLYHETGVKALRIDDLLERATAMRALVR